MLHLRVHAPSLAIASLIVHLTSHHTHTHTHSLTRSVNRDVDWFIFYLKEKTTAESASKGYYRALMKPMSQRRRRRQNHLDTHKKQKNFPNDNQHPLQPRPTLIVSAEMPCAMSALPKMSVVTSALSQLARSAKPSRGDADACTPFSPVVGTPM